MLEKQLETRTLPDFPKYLFREDGAVLSLSRPGTILHPFTHDGHPTVCLMTDTGKRTSRVAILICEAFHGRPPPRSSPRHRDLDSRNCSASNLYYGQRMTRWADDHVAQSLEVSQAISYSCRECGGHFEAADIRLVVHKRDRRCRYCQFGLLADVEAHEHREATLALLGRPTHSTETLVERAHLNEDLQLLFRNTLRNREQAVLFMRFWEDATLDEAAAPHELTRERIRQIENQARHRLRDAIKDHRHRYPDHFDVVFPEEVYKGTMAVPVREPPEEPPPAVHKVQKPEVPEITVDFDALASLLES